MSKTSPKEEIKHHAIEFCTHVLNNMTYNGVKMFIKNSVNVKKKYKEYTQSKNNNTINK